MHKAPLQPFFDPQAIERESLAIIDAETPEPRPFAGREWVVARRLVHTTADFDLLTHLRFHPEAVEAGMAALAGGATVVTDTRMAREGIPDRRRQALGFRVVCHMGDPEVAAEAAARAVTRAFAAMEKAASLPGPLVFALGNAPTALLRVLELVDAGRIAPALIVGMPVGFVNAAQSKDLLLAQSRIPYVAIAGRKGGSALAAATVNALAQMCLDAREGKE